MIPTTSPTQLSIEYAIANPEATADAIQALFGVRRSDADYAVQRGIDANRKDWPIHPEPKQKRPLNNTNALAAAREWAAVNHATESNIYSQFNITSKQAREISKEAFAAKGGVRAGNTDRERALAHLKANPHESLSSIATRFHVSREWLRMQRNKLSGKPIAFAARKVEPEIQPRKPMNRLFAWVDGVRVDTHTYRGSKGFDRCEGVKV